MVLGRASYTVVPTAGSTWTCLIEASKKFGWCGTRYRHINFELLLLAHTSIHIPNQITLVDNFIPESISIMANLGKRGREPIISPDIECRVMRYRVDQEHSWIQTLSALVGGAAHIIKKHTITDYFGCRMKAPAAAVQPMETTVTCFACTGTVDTVVTCSFCCRKACHACVSSCIKCQGLFCKYCSSVNYDESQTRIFCLDCDR